MGRGGGDCTESSPSQWGPSNWASVGEAPQPAAGQRHSTAALLPGPRSGAPATTATWGRVRGARPGAAGAASARGCPQQRCQDAGGGSRRWPNKGGLCAARQPASLARRRFSIRALVNRQRPEETAAARPAPGLSPTLGVLREPRSSAGAREARQPPRALLCSPRAFGTAFATRCVLGRASCQELPVAGRGQEREQPPAPGDSGCSCGHLPRCSRCCAELGSRCPSSSLGPSRAAAGACRGARGSPAAVLSKRHPRPCRGSASWGSRALAPRNLLPAQPGRGRAGVPQCRAEGGLSAAAAGKGRATLLGRLQTLSGA